MEEDSRKLYFSSTMNIFSLDWEYSHDYSDEEDACELDNTNFVCKSTVVELTVGGQPVKSLVDSGADVSLCSSRALKRWSSITIRPLAKCTNVVLMDYTGTRRKCISGVVLLPL